MILHWRSDDCIYRTVSSAQSARLDFGGRSFDHLQIAFVEIGGVHGS
jgi:hypothetical protein